MSPSCPPPSSSRSSPPRPTTSCRNNPKPGPESKDSGPTPPRNPPPRLLPSTATPDCHPRSPPPPAPPKPGPKPKPSPRLACIFSQPSSHSRPIPARTALSSQLNRLRSPFSHLFLRIKPFIFNDFSSAKDGIRKKLTVDLRFR